MDLKSTEKLPLPELLPATTLDKIEFYEYKKPYLKTQLILMNDTLEPKHNEH